MKCNYLSLPYFQNCSKETAVGIRPWMNNYIPQFNVEIINIFPHPDSDSVNLLEVFIILVSSRKFWIT